MLLLTLVSAWLFHQSNSLSATLEERMDALSRNENEYARVVADLRDEIAKQVRTLKRTVKVYHYGTRGPINYFNDPNQTLVFNQDEAIDLKRNGSYDSPVELNPPEATEYFRQLSGSFASAKQIRWNVGPGLYAAMDPIQSQNYAGNPWFLLEITVPAGTKYLEVRPVDGVIVSQVFMQKWFSALNDLDTGKVTRIEKDRFVIGFRAMLALPQLRQLIVDASKTLNVDFITYAWIAPTIQICKKRMDGIGTGFNFINPKFLDRKPILNVFTQSLDHPSSAQKLAYEKLLKKVEASEVIFSQNQSQNQANQKHTDVFQETTLRDWVSQFRIQTATMNWSSSFQTSSLLNDLIFGDSSLSEKMAKYSEEYNRCIGNYCVQNFTPVFLEKNFKTTIVHSNFNGYKSYHLDPMAQLKKLKPIEYQKRLKMIESETFGCSPDSRFQEERTLPEFKKD